MNEIELKKHLFKAMLKGYIYKEKGKGTYDIAADSELDSEDWQSIREEVNNILNDKILLDDIDFVFGTSD